MSDSLSKTDLVNCLVENCKAYSSKTDAKKAIDAVLGCIEKNLSEGKDINIIGFGKWELRNRKSRQGRNPQTGQVVQIAASKTIGFKPSSNIKKLINS